MAEAMGKLRACQCVAGLPAQQHTIGPHATAQTPQHKHHSTQQHSTQQHSAAAQGRARGSPGQHLQVLVPSGCKGLQKVCQRGG